MIAKSKTIKVIKLTSTDLNNDPKPINRLERLIMCFDITFTQSELDKDKNKRPAEFVKTWEDQGIALVKKASLKKVKDGSILTKKPRKVYYLNTIAAINKILIINELLDYEKQYFHDKQESGPLAYIIHDFDYCILISPLTAESRESIEKRLLST